MIVLGTTLLVRLGADRAATIFRRPGSGWVGTLEPVLAAAVAWAWLGEARGAGRSSPAGPWRRAGILLAEHRSVGAAIREFFASRSAPRGIAPRALGRSA